MSAAARYCEGCNSNILVLTTQLSSSGRGRVHKRLAEAHLDEFNGPAIDYASAVPLAATIARSGDRRLASSHITAWQEFIATAASAQGFEVFEGWMVLTKGGTNRQNDGHGLPSGSVRHRRAETPQRRAHCGVHPPSTRLTMSSIDDILASMKSSAAPSAPPPPSHAWTSTEDSTIPSDSQRPPGTPPPLDESHRVAGGEKLDYRFRTGAVRLTESDAAELCRTVNGDERW